jgi:ABC-type Na+ efflux pump permease subunit
VGPEKKKILVLDSSGEVFEHLKKSAEARNEGQIFDESGKQIKPRFELELASTGQPTDELRLELSDRIRRGEIDSFVEIPADVLRMPSPGNDATVRFYAENAALAEEKGWLQWVLNDTARTQRLTQAVPDDEQRKLVNQAGMPVAIEGRGLVELSREGKPEDTKEANELLTVFVPFGLMMLMWMVIFLAAQPLMESVMEEKSQRIAEVLMGSANPFQLMAGKLLGGVGGSLTIVVLYGAGAYFVAGRYEATQYVPLRVVPWFIVFQVLAVLLFGSVFMAVGAAVNQLKEAQAMLLPVWLVMMFPLFVWLHVIREPTSGFATALSFIPPATPLLMVLRMTATTAVPLWQPILGVVVLVATTLLCVFAAGRIFRIGFLTQGKAPNFVQLARWAFRG